MSIDIKGLDKADIIFALYKASKPPKNIPSGQTEQDVYGSTPLEDLKIVIADLPDPNYIMIATLNGRAIYVVLDGDVLLREDLYDAESGGGSGSCAKVIESLRAKQVSSK